MGRQYRHILLDGWQDTNGPQYDLVLEIVHARRRAWRSLGENVQARFVFPPLIFVVGDTDRCMYTFRGEDYTSVARFVQNFKGCLGENVRSTANIANAAAAVIGNEEQFRWQTTVATTAAQVGCLRWCWCWCWCWCAR